MKAVLLKSTFVVLSLGMAMQASADDTIVVQPEGYTGKLVLRGNVIDFSNKGMMFRSRAGGAIQQFPASSVLEVTTPQTEAHTKGLELFAKERIEEARAAFGEALKEEQRTWVRHEILAMDIRCLLWTGDYSSAATRFMLLVDSDPQTRHFGLIPLIWTPAIHDAALRSAARVWLSKPDEVPGLIGASILLNDPQHRSLAEQRLNQLTNSTNRLIYPLAQAQLWRVHMENGELTNSELGRFQKRIEDMPEEIRGGPYFLLGMGYLQQQQYEQAAAAFLWLPLVYTADRGLGARACLEGADALNHIGQRAEAISLYSEVARRYHDTPYQTMATGVLNSLVPASPAGTDSADGKDSKTWPSGHKADKVPTP